MSISSIMLSTSLTKARSIEVELDGAVTFLHDYADIGVTSFHHNIDRGKFGLAAGREYGRATKSHSTWKWMRPAM